MKVKEFIEFVVDFVISFILFAFFLPILITLNLLMTFGDFDIFKSCEILEGKIIDIIFNYRR